MKKLLLLLIACCAVYESNAQNSGGFPGECTMYFKQGTANCRSVTFKYKDGEPIASVSGDAIMQGTRYYKYTGKSGGYLSFIGYTEKQVYQTRMKTLYMNGQATQVPEFMHIENERNGRSMSVSCDYKTFVFNGETYNQRISKQEYDEIQAAIKRGVARVSGGYVPNGSSNGSSSNGSKYERLPSRHGDATCKSCGGSGRCTACGGTGNSIKEEYDSVLGRSVRVTSNCGVCRGTGNCGVCHGSGKIHY